MSAPLLHVQDLRAGYGSAPVLHGVSFALAAGEIVALLGRNGAGRSTTGKALMGLVPASGQVHWRGQSLLGQPVFARARAGLGYVPEGRDVFPTLSVQQNLVLGQKGRRPGRQWGFEQVYTLFPRLRERQHTAAGLLSGGEQQMLALARTLMGEPQALIIDEPAEGLAPQLVVQVAQCLLDLRRQGVAVLLIEQKLDIALRISDRALLMGQGRIVYSGSPAGLLAQPQLRREWLEV